ncbi:MAG: ferredoxin [Angelakisella sp.]
MKVKIEDGCIGCGLCANTCPNIFRMTDEGVAEVYAQPNPDEESTAKEAADGCPVSVIMIDN